MRVRRWLGNLLAVGLAAGMSVLVAEIALRLLGVRYPAFYVVDSQRGYGLRPGARGLWTREGRGSVSINRAGFRGPLPARMPPEGSLRIAVLGDSFTEALQVDRQQTWLQQLQARMNALPTCELRGGRQVEVLNFGVGGYGTGQQLLTWRHQARRYRPDLVLLALYPGNDFTDNEPIARTDRPVFSLDAEGRLTVDDRFRHTPGHRFRSSPAGRLLDALINHSRVLQLLNEAKNRFSGLVRAGSGPAGAAAATAPPPPPEASEQAWAVTAALLRTLKQDVEASGARLLVISTSSPDQLWPDGAQRPADPFRQERRLSALLSDADIDHLLLGPPLQRQVDAEGLVLHGFPGQQPGQGHWNEEGHRRAAALIAPWLCAQ
jgi:lysophospholipase L1-like esterase